ncbi:MAG: dihydrodipicolinate synthase family protein [Haloplanus sp.]
MPSSVPVQELSDLITGLVTPFDEELNVDHAALAENARALSAHDVGAFFVCSNVGEYHSLSHEERVAVTETGVDALPSDTTVLAGAGGSTKTVIELGTAYESLDVDVLLVMPPDHTYVHERGLLDYYRKIGDNVALPLVPYLRGFDPSPGFVADLTTLDSVVGIKWALRDLPKFATAVDRGADDIVWINGLGEQYAIAFHSEGASGMASGIGNFDPSVGRALYDALDRGALERAREIRNATIPFMRFREETGAANTLPAANSIPVVKAGLEFAGLTGGRVREPLMELTDGEHERAGRLYRELQSLVGDGPVSDDQ